MDIILLINTIIRIILKLIMIPQVKKFEIKQKIKLMHLYVQQEVEEQYRVVLNILKK